MIPCEDVRNLIEDYLGGTLEEERRQAVVRHLKTCPGCHRAMQEARLAAMVLHEAAQLPAPPDLAGNIKAAARTRLFYRPRPLHERALGSPAFMATCASLLCGAIICLVAIIRVGSVPVDPNPVRVAAATPVEVHSLVRMERPETEQFVAAAARLDSPHPQLHIVAQDTAPIASEALAVTPAPISTASRAVPREARYDRAVAVRAVSRLKVETLNKPALALVTQRTSLPEPTVQTSYSMFEQGRSPSVATDLPSADGHLTTVDLSDAAPADDALSFLDIDLGP